ncbi:MAG: stage V sporulation protein AC [Clostridia bacterium]|nr:stage V sporulation protein AC [Clostridia bacterium]
MKMTAKTYGELVSKVSPPSPKIKDFIGAFLIGGLICVSGQLLQDFYTALSLSDKAVRMAVPSTLVFLSALLTGLNLYQKIAKHAGAGTLVPITGFANAMVSPAIEFKNEGQVLGVGAKMFGIAGPVLVFGISASVIYGIILCLIRLF